MARAGAQGTPVFLIGGKPEVLAQTEQQLRQRWNVNIVGSGMVILPLTSVRRYLSVSAIAGEDRHGGDGLAASGDPDARLSGRLSAGAVYGRGWHLRCFTGHVQRAPKFWQDTGLEWFYRTVSQPSRIKAGAPAALFTLALHR